jgi:hypothetical protein
MARREATQAEKVAAYQKIDGPKGQALLLEELGYRTPSENKDDKLGDSGLDVKRVQPITMWRRDANLGWMPWEIVSANIPMLLTAGWLFSPPAGEDLPRYKGIRCPVSSCRKPIKDVAPIGFSLAKDELANPEDVELVADALEDSDTVEQRLNNRVLDHLRYAHSNRKDLIGFYEGQVFVVKKHSLPEKPSDFELE